MYRITRDGGACIGMTEAPNYIKQAQNGSYVLCPEPEASGIAFNGVAYHIMGRTALKGAETVMLEEVDAGPDILAANRTLADTDGMVVDLEYRLTLLELGIADEGTTN